MEAKLRENWQISKYLGKEIERKQKKLRAGNTNTQFLSLFSLFNMYSYQLLDDTTVLESSVQEHQVLAILLVIED